MIWLLIFLLAPASAFAELDYEVGDVYWDDGTPAIVISVSEDKTQIIIDTELYRKREAEQKAWETEQRQLRRDQVMEEILRELKRR